MIASFTSLLANASAVLAQEYSYSASSSGDANPLVIVCVLAFVLLVIISLWKVFTKAGEPGWAAIIPIYNTIVMIKIAGRPIWWFLLMFIPFVNLIITIIVMIDLAKAFGKGAGFGIGLTFLGFIFFPILAFGDAQYQGVKTA